MKNFDIFVDGSHLKPSGRLGCGGLLVDSTTKTVIDTFKMELLPEYVKITFGADTCSNPTAEMIGVLQALYHFGPRLKGAGKVTIYSDYLGVREWNTGKWKIKEPYIQRVKDDLDDEISKLGLKGKIGFAWVKGHQGLKDIGYEGQMNNLADKLAKGEDL